MKQKISDCARMMLVPEKCLLDKGFDWVIGLDEAGRGPLAGPVVAAAVAVVPNCHNLADIILLAASVNDSKKMSAAARNKAFFAICRCAKIYWSVSVVSPKVIDRINILEAAKLAMVRAAKKIVCRIGVDDSDKIYCLVDGNQKIKTSCPQNTVVRGDSRVFSIAAASVVAKTVRDRIMAKYDLAYPGWDFARHKGYPTKAHTSLLAKQPATPIHRKTFNFVKQIL